MARCCSISPADAATALRPCAIRVLTSSSATGTCCLATSATHRSTSGGRNQGLEAYRSYHRRGAWSRRYVLPRQWTGEAVPDPVDDLRNIGETCDFDFERERRPYRSLPSDDVPQSAHRHRLHKSNGLDPHVWPDRRHACDEIPHARVRMHGRRSRIVAMISVVMGLVPS